MIALFFGKILQKIRILFSSLRYRLSFYIFTGKVRVDSLSISRCSLGSQASIRGSISCYDSSILLGAFVATSESSEINAAENGVITIGNNASLGPRSIISTTSGTITIGAGTSFFSDCHISGSISIGKVCLFAKNVTVLSGTHQIYGDGTIRENDALSQIDSNRHQLQNVEIGDDCWLGMNTVILPGVTLGKGAVVGANAVVTKSFPDYSIVAGVPARIIGSRLR